MVKKFNIKKIEQELLDINKENDIETSAAVQLITNQMNMCNEMLDLYKAGDTNKVFLLYQLNGQIFKMLKEFNILPNGARKNDKGNSQDIKDGEFMNRFNGENSNE